MSILQSQFEAQKSFFQSGKTLSHEFRVKALLKLKNLIIDNKESIFEALSKDLNRSEAVSYISEYSVVLHEINLHIKKLKKWMKVRSVSTPLSLMPAKSMIRPMPKGVTLIIAPWNYPFQLLIAPLIGSISAGCTTILKPSELSTHTEHMISKIFSTSFPSEYIKVITGDSNVVTELLKLNFDHIFFTGSTYVGKIIARAAAENLTSVTLELGGKSPCIVFGNVDLDITARRIVFGKLFNTGQTCIAPDYLLVDKKNKDELIKKILFYIQEFYSQNPKTSKDYGRIINRRHFERLEKLISNVSTKYSVGDSNIEELFFAPTIVHADINSTVMQEEIFGPILPVIEVETFDDIFNIVMLHPNPLALYLFTDSKIIEHDILSKIAAGGVTINDTLLHFSNPNLAFGGFKQSGIGGYHGKSTFDIFTREMPVLKKGWSFDMALRYPAYTLNKMKWLKRLL